MQKVLRQFDLQPYGATVVTVRLKLRGCGVLLNKARPQSISCGTRLGKRCMMWWNEPQCMETRRNYGWDGSGCPGVRSRTHTFT